jgi:hypothetical protein
MLSSYVLRFSVSVASVLGIGVTVAAAQPRIDPPQVPTNLAVPGDHYVYLAAHAIGTQNYMCLPTDKSPAWRLIGPQATLFVPIDSNQGQQVITHFLSANPLEDDLARPTWQHSIDTSRVWGRAAASSVDPNYVAPDAIPWLLVQATGASLGPSGGSLLTATTYIHRVNTVGGVAPSAGCAKSRDVGTFALVSYETDYYFYRANR